MIFLGRLMTIGTLYLEAACTPAGPEIANTMDFVVSSLFNIVIGLSARRPLTLVCAGAGYGKTTLVSSWIDGMAAGGGGPTSLLPCAWLSLDEHASDLGLFLRYVIAAMRTIFPSACAATSSLLQATRQPPFDLLSATFIDEIVLPPRDFILVLDDHHLIGGTVVSDLLSQLAQQWPQPLHVGDSPPVARPLECQRDRPAAFCVAQHGKTPHGQYLWEARRPHTLGCRGQGRSLGAPASPIIFTNPFLHHLYTSPVVAQFARRCYPMSHERLAVWQRLDV